LLGAPADSAGSVATQAVTIPAPGAYRVWSKYQAPPYFNYLHKIEVTQKGKTLFSHVYGKKGTPRLWSFSGESDELWWPWGVDHTRRPLPAAVRWRHDQGPGKAGRGRTAERVDQHRPVLQARPRRGPDADSSRRRSVRCAGGPRPGWQGRRRRRQAVERRNAA